MRVTFRNILKAYSGSVDGLTYYYNKRLDRLLCRKYVKPKETIQNKILANKSINLAKLNLSDNYIQDLKHYAILASSNGGYLNWRNVFLKLMYKLEKDYQLDLSTITRDQIFAEGLPCITVAKAIESGLLLPIPGYDRLNSEM